MENQIPNTPINAPENLEHHVAPSKQKWILIGAVAVTILILLGGGSYFFFSQNKTPTTGLILTSGTPALTPSGLSTANWKTYSNPELGISFKYPETVDDSYKGGSEFPAFISLTLPIETSNVIRKQIRILYFRTGETPKKRVDEILKQREYANPPQTKTRSQILLDGIPAEQLITTIPTSSSISIYVKPKDVMFQIMSEYDRQNKEYFDAFLSTVKFTDPTSTPTCKPRPACLDSEPRCLIPETPDMCPPSITP